MLNAEPAMFDKKVSCPYCGYGCDAASTLGEESKRPKEGDICVCLMCANLNEYTDAEGGLQKLSQEKMDAILDEAPEIWLEIKRLQDGILEFRKTHVPSMSAGNTKG